MGFRKSVSITLVTRISNFVLTLGTNILVARLLGPQGKGVLAVTLLVLNMLFVFSNMGLAAPIIYYVSKRKYSLADVASTLLSFVLFLSVALVALTAGLVNTFSFAFLKGVSPALISVIVLALPFKLLSSFYNSIFLALQRIKLYNIFSVLPSIFFIVSFMVFFIFSRALIWNFIYSQLIAQALTCAVVYVGLTRITRIYLRHNFSFMKEALRFGLKTYFDNITSLFNYRLDMFIVNYFLATTAVGYYSLAVGLAEFLWFIPGATATILFPHIAAAKKEEAKAFTPIVCRNILVITASIALVYFVFGKVIVRFVYGEAFLPSVYPLWMLLPGVVMVSVYKIIASDLLGRGKPMITAIISAFALLFTIGFDLLLIPKYGVMGAAAASTIAYTVEVLIGMFFYLRLSGNSLWEMLIIKQIDLLGYKNGLLRLLPVGLIKSNASR